MGNHTKQYFILTAAGKRLIAKAVLQIPSIVDSLKNKTIVVIAGTTNGYIVEELLRKTGLAEGFTKNRFFRGVSLPPKYVSTDTGRLGDESHFPGDVVLVKGVWDKGKTIFDVVADLKQGDVILKGANAINLDSRQAAVCIGHPTGGTITAILQAVIGKRVELIIPVGLEKRISGDINDIAHRLNAMDATGLRYLPISGNLLTELDAIRILTGAQAELFAGGGISGAEGGYWIAVTGNTDQLTTMDLLAKDIKDEPSFMI